MANPFQKAALKRYGHGDYSHAESEADCVGDTLALFVFRELADDGDELMDRETAIKRIEVAINDLQTVYRAICYETGEQIKAE